MINYLKKILQKINIFKIASTVFALLIIITIMLYDVPVNQSWSSWTLPLSGYIFILDPGHGGPDGGAVSKSGIVEKDITLSISKYLRDYLNEAGALVIMTRDSDKDLAELNTKGLSRRKLEDLKNRVNLANRSLADFFVSIHLNSISSSKWRGAQTFYYPIREENKKMAIYIQEELIKNLQNTDRVPLPRNDIIVLKYVELPSVMVEVGFLSNSQEAELLKDEEYQRKIAFAIYQGMLTYYSKQTP
ncbi:N-acetylmuramoyl-L-alanine amidase CwlD [Vulcanibacillus modesticaldus]|uniref:N-acetylmuramoyl-L-alanine amidase CwlD n=1 Tax=Vulcanibacillus modesticaldus TaxID=337097 RepID=A0A1D2YS52_9BACI|nr:N-acetylmuramoyl-L-alanine amidase CwlD [Vulcanibacillus modesticaldus]OEF96453.1 N-acetylmuramoyl-L-alanine amidase CwlD [Vulcanibacillus modesticaldus]